MPTATFGTLASPAANGERRTADQAFVTACEKGTPDRLPEMQIHIGSVMKAFR